MRTDEQPTLRVLVIDDDESARSFIARSLARKGFQTSSSNGGREAMTILREERFDAVVCDLLMPEVDGLDVLRYCTTLDPQPSFLMLTAHGNVGVAVSAMKLGAVDFLEKPISATELDAALRSVLEKGKKADPQRPSQMRPRKVGLVGSDSWLGPFSELLQKIATTDAIVLIEGETGTGKSAVAREIWRLSNRARGPFIEVNCAAIAKELIENELFGNIKGAFTGAIGQVGKVEKANDGTLFLDEIGELPLELQAKLLQLLQERTFTPVGATSPRRANVRFIAATNRQLEAEARSGNFRADLYFRLEVVKLTIPPLRERIEDVPILVEYFQRVSAERHGRAPVFPSETVAALSRYEWPGNVRELENLVARLSVMLDGGEDAKIEDLPERIQRAAGAHRPEPSPAAPAAGFTHDEPNGRAPRPPALDDVAREGLAMALKNYESGLIRHALRKTNDNVTQAAKYLRMKRTTLIEKRRRYEELGLL